MAQGAQAGTPVPAGDPSLARYRVLEEAERKDVSVVFKAEDTQLKKVVAIRVLPEEEARGSEVRQRLLKRVDLSQPDTHLCL